MRRPSATTLRPRPAKEQYEVFREVQVLTVARVAVAVALCVYAAGVVANTVFPVFLDIPRASGWHIVTQFVTAHLLGGGHIADVNDLLFNTAGGALGVGLFAALVRKPAAAAL